MDAAQRGVAGGAHRQAVAAREAQPGGDVCRGECGAYRRCKGNRIYDKRRSTGKIDALVALAEGVGLLLTDISEQIDIMGMVA